MWREGVLTRTPARRAVTHEHHLHVIVAKGPAVEGLEERSV